MYTVIIIDDEEEIRNGLIKKVDWNKYGFKIIDTAENGKEALEKIEKLKPDVIFTDIKMPFLSGVELIKIIYQRMYNTKSVVISGFNDFEYAKEVMNNNAFGYLLKPIDAGELENILIKIKNNFEIEYNNKRNLDILKNYYIQSLPIIKNQFFTRLIQGKFDKNILFNKNLDIDFNSKYFIVSVIKYNFKEENIFKENDELLPFSIKNILDEKIQEFEKDIKFYTFFYFDSVVSIFNIDNKQKISSIINELNNFCDVYYKIMGIKISVGLGYCVENIEDIKNSYEGAEEALLYKFMLGIGKVIYINDLEPDKNIKLSFTEEQEKKLESLIKLGEENDIKIFINKILDINNDKIIDFKEYKIYYMEIMLFIYKLTKNYNINLDDFFGTDFEIKKTIDKFESINNVKQYFLKKCIDLANFIKKQRVDSTNALVQKAKAYIDENYSNTELSVNNICEILFVSPTYFSSIFKKYLNISFIKYLTELRLEKALELMNTTSEKTYTIAEKVGYSDANYFSYAFKKKYGISPLKYRNNKE